MTSTLQVQTLQGPTSGADSNVIRVADGHNLHAKGHVVQCVYHEWNDVSVRTSSSFGPANGSKISFTPKFANSLLVIIYDFSFAAEYVSGVIQTGGACKIFHDGTYLQNLIENTEFYTNASSYSLQLGAAIITRQTKINSVAAGSTSARDIELHFGVFTPTSHKATVNRDGNRSNLLVQEIAQ